ncbi:MAG: homocysteine S-methyltransferase family protein [Candidatus Puniceispirillum sp.]|jgi:S-methylmethionine-dependent homocysteine/selenocysteine methylase|uniref:homocysteine S-methyltransferase family protein n=1 Tax=uncultured Candidatus Puniceispirillum sp. TaxID=1985115 RepID=UPI002A6C9997|nr:homocysteine S-methyltransferase family protein [Candidatus Puniceispirillum sp.]MBT6567246.1 homocysteine S-methyltransferase family protein [Candidatus Puniceispirillum sp.]
MIILDGGLGRQLAAIGAPFRQPEWSALALMEAPQFVRDVHDSFIDAGADVITTNSYAIVPFHIGQDRFDALAPQLLTLSGTLAQAAAEAADRQVKVAASIPPMFGSYEPDKFDPQMGQQMMQLFQRYLAPSADIFLAETLGSVLEARTFLDCFVDCAADLWLSVTLEDVKPEPAMPRLRSGEPLSALLDVIATMRLDGLLFNCSQPEVMLDAVTCVSAFRDRQPPRPTGLGLQIGVYANAFPLMDDDYEHANSTLNEMRHDVTPQRYAEYAVQWAAAGADIIGGCCGISPDHITTLRATI